MEYTINFSALDNFGLGFKYYETKDNDNVDFNAVLTIDLLIIRIGLYILK